MKCVTDVCVIKKMTQRFMTQNKSDLVVTKNAVTKFFCHKINCHKR
ncbi:MAG: hypothetical protein RLZZ543_334 [Bacteroidota bacterium]|jgi:hypothetical protein